MQSIQDLLVQLFGCFGGGLSVLTVGGGDIKRGQPIDEPLFNDSHASVLNVLRFEFQRRRTTKYLVFQNA